MIKIPYDLRQQGIEGNGAFSAWNKVFPKQIFRSLQSFSEELRKAFHD